MIVRKKINSKLIASAVTVFVLIAIMVRSCYMKPPYAYIRLSFLDGASLIFAVIFTYFLIERGSEKRQRKEYCERLIMKLQEQLESECLKKPTVESYNITLLTIRSVQSKLKLLANIKGDIDPNDIRYVQDRFNEYEEFFGEHCQDQKYLCSSEHTCIRMLTLISDKLEGMAIGLYK